METVIIVLILTAALVSAGRSLLKTLNGSSTCAGTCSGCTMKCGEAGKGR